MEALPEGIFLYVVGAFVFALILMNTIEFKDRE